MRPIARTLLFACPLATLGAHLAGPRAVQEEVVTFDNGDLSLAGTLTSPPGEGPFPAVVIVHGSGASDRSNPWTSAYATALVERGIAVLHPDKRGSGQSGGDWRSATLVELAEDVLAGVELLQDHPAIDAARLGVIGFSQGGDVVPIVASASPLVTFVIDVSGSVVPLREQIGDEIRLAGMREGMTADELEVLGSIHERGAHFALTGEGWDEYESALKEATAGSLSKSPVLAGFPRLRESESWKFFSRIVGFDPLPYWLQVDVPTLFLYGGRDHNVDVYKSVDLIEREFSRDGPPYSLLLFRNNGHALFREDALDFIARWILDGGID